MEGVVQRAALMLALIVALGACGPGRDISGKRHATLTDLQGEVEYSLIPPGAVVTGATGRNGYQNITGYEHAYAGHDFRTASPYTAVAKYYHDELTKLGWIPGGLMLLRRSDEEGRSWCRPGRRLDLRLRTARQDGQFTYEVFVIGSEAPCPDRFQVPSLSPAPTAPPRPPGQGPP